MLRTIVIGAAIFTFSAVAFAQSALVGKWGGHYIFKGSTRGDQNVGVDVEIISVEGNAVKGVAKSYSRFCGGEFQMSGKLDGNNHRMASPDRGGGAGDCKFAFQATVDGDKMTGKFGNSDLFLTKK